MSKKLSLSPEQDLAANPLENVWVQANAGTGKTSVLVQRLLRIMFRADNGGGILCLTYTNAAAGEMRNRILKALREWAMATDDELTELLRGVSINKNPTADDLAHAREIFFTYIDNPDILKIKTIHGFCEEILRRFPLEAGLSPSWTLVSDTSQKVLLRDAFDRLINSSVPTPRTTNAFARIVERISEYSVDNLLKTLSSQVKYFFQVDNIDNYRNYFIDTTKNFLKLNLPKPPEAIPANLQKIIEMVPTVQKPTKTLAARLDTLVNLTKQYLDKTIDFDEYKFAYLTASALTPISVLKNLDFLTDEQTRVYDTLQYNQAQDIFNDTMALFDLSSAFSSEYSKIKQQCNALDFDDMILYTRRLFSKPETMGWVLSQLDLSLSHILLDEAQDTSPAQWDILRMMAGDFFADGDTPHDVHALFVVGDSKQSIYGFQGADPTAFADSRTDIATQIEQNMRTIREIPLAQSFRSAAPVLKTVDAFFSNPEIVRVTNFHNNNHKCFRQNEPGLVEIHPLTRGDDGIDKKQYIAKIADNIEQILKAPNITPGDIMVLLCKRDPLGPILVKELKRRKIEIAGSDRITLPDFPAIRDLLNLTRFCLNTDDNYSLCCTLKSPLFRLTEADILKLCNAVNPVTKKQKQKPIFDILDRFFPDVHAALKEIVTASTTQGPYSFFTGVLNSHNARENMIAALGEQIIDPLEEFLTMCLAYERTQPGTLHHFLKWFITGDSESKRDMDKSRGIRIVTVHGSKGLEAKVIFLVDTTDMPKTDPIYQITPQIAPANVPVRPDLPSPWLWQAPGSKNAALTAAADIQKAQKLEEHYRLLYVAMTRACDNLYIYGYVPQKSAPENSWHARLYQTFEHMAGPDGIIRITNDNMPA